jgi:hypothetical protein
LSYANNVFVDEVQSDVPSAIDELQLPPERSKKLYDIIFGGTHPSELLHEAFHEAARQNGLVGKPVRLHSTDTKKVISLTDQNKPVPVHFVRNYEDVPKKRLNAEPSTYGKNPDETHTEIQGKRVWETYFKKSEKYSDWDV